MSLKTTPIDCSNETHEVTFHDACAKGNRNVIVQYFSQKGFDMYIVDKLGRTGFHLACFKGNLNVVKFLVRKQFDMYVGDEDRNHTGFHMACFMGNLNVVQFLLEEGFDMNVPDSDGNRGFHAACFMGRLNVVQFLLRRGFDMNVANRNGITGFHCACSSLNPFLRKVGFSVPKCYERTKFTFHGTLNVVKFLLEEGFDMYLGEKNGLTGFHGACAGGNLKAVQFLVQQKHFDMNTVDNNGKTGFILAAVAGNLNIIWFLLHHEFTNINEFSIGSTGLDILIDERSDYLNDELYMPCVLFLIEADGEVSEDHVLSEELISVIQNRITEITFLKKIIDKYYTERIAQLITDFTMEPFTDISLQNLSNFLDNTFEHEPNATRTICSLS